MDRAMANPERSTEPDASERILAAAVQVIDVDGETSLRVTDVAERAGVATALINHHFRSREGLVASAQERRYNRVILEDLARLLDHFDATQSRAETAAALRTAFASIATRDRASNRLARITALAAAHGRPRPPRAGRAPRRGRVEHDRSGDRGGVEGAGDRIAAA